MAKLSIDLADYGHVDGFGSASQEEIAQLNKALEAEQITGRETTDLTTASGAPLKVESLEKTLKHLTFRESDIKLWKELPKKPAYNTVEEYNQQTSYGENRGGWNREGELPEEEDSTFVRRAQLVKYLGVTKSVTHQMTLVNTVLGSVMTKTINDGTMWILRTLNQGLYWGDAELIPEQFNGFLSQQARCDAWTSLDEYMNSEHVIDLRGGHLSEDAIEDGANTIIENFGLGDQLYAAPAVLSNFVKNFYGNKFIQPNTAALTDGVMGQKVKSFESQYGNIGLDYDIFFKKLPHKNADSAATSNKAPEAPTWDASTPAAVQSSVSGSKWGSTEAGTVYYAVSAINRYGESKLAVLSSAGVVATAGCAIDLKFAATASTNAATAFRIYRTKVGGSATGEFYPLFEVSVKELTAGYDGAAGGLVRDMNYFLPDTDQAFLVQFDNEVIEFAQLAPLMKMDLAVLSPAYRFMILLYGTPFLYAPKKMVRLINIGTKK